MISKDGGAAFPVIKNKVGKKGSPNRVGDVRQCPSCGERIIVTQKMVSRKKYCCQGCECSRARQYVEKNRDKKRRWNRDYSKRHKEKHNAKTKIYRINNAEKRAAHAAVQSAIRSGKLIATAACEECGAIGRIHAHHDDYSQALAVRWLCPICHAENHRAKEESK